MATQGILSIVRDNEVAIKVVTGADGYNISKLVDWFKENKDATAKEVYDAAVKLKVGPAESLVVQYGPKKFYADSEMGELGPLYAEKFNDPKFNPRWNFGTADHMTVIDQSGPKMKIDNKGRDTPELREYDKQLHAYAFDKTGTLTPPEFPPKKLIADAQENVERALKYINKKVEADEKPEGSTKKVKTPKP